MSKPNGRARKLMEHRQVLASDLPPFSEIVRGSLVTRYRRCGKPTCHCATGEGHGPAHYLAVTLKPGKTEQILLSEEMLPVARQFLNNYNRWWAALEKVSAVNRRLLRLRVAELTGKKKSSRNKSD
ncbi:MAG TPA: DUF6788 family protein [Candidatus Acidoferrales bacterium]|nr:DUF6788 family protein [Candidatus Acidoferrales bacterium]